MELRPFNVACACPVDGCTHTESADVAFSEPPLLRGGTLVLTVTVPGAAARALIEHVTAVHGIEPADDTVCAARGPRGETCNEHDDEFGIHYDTAAQSAWTTGEHAATDCQCDEHRAH